MFYVFKLLEHIGVNSVKREEDFVCEQVSFAVTLDSTVLTWLFFVLKQVRLVFVRTLIEQVFKGSFLRKRLIFVFFHRFQAPQYVDILRDLVNRESTNNFWIFLFFQIVFPLHYLPLNRLTLKKESILICSLTVLRRISSEWYRVIGGGLSWHIQLTCWNRPDERNSFKHFFRLVVLSFKCVGNCSKNCNAFFLAVQELFDFVVSGLQGHLWDTIFAGNPLVYEAEE